jgi:hypothetical protein
MRKKVSQNRIFFLTVTAGGGAAPRNSLVFNELESVNFYFYKRLFFVFSFCLQSGLLQGQSGCEALRVGWSCMMSYCIGVP